MTGYTKGPWKVYKGSVHPVLEDGSNGNDSFAICECFGPDAIFNSRLLAAAPDLLEALQLMIADFADYPASERPCLAFDKARAAIAKAIPPAPAPQATTASQVVDSNSGAEGTAPEKGSL